MSNGAKHIVLAGDSIFDNDIYVMGEPGVVEQLRSSIPKDWSAYKIAIDGSCIRDVSAQLERLPTHATELVLSVGGNDAREYRYLMSRIKTPGDIKSVLSGAKAEFAAQYAALLETLQTLQLRILVCSIYTAIPFDEPEWRLFGPVAINEFNEVIRREAAKRGIPVLALEEICVEDADFSSVSPIEPSSIGGQKIVNGIISRVRST
ncbi:SGNH/GDSL hydrolase family protein [Ponticaulis sp.]|uniref:SGNH/GDSL hydrolase family protein n=1 Tax=Ponticaulis sp. TaxID=2020902 RepID=UPI000B6E2AA7|nr:SGNH/GDSL hydrolase family protein [Ponticaulis sp.]MAJ08680.1 lipase [Ponticaulis sp.]RPG17386.1 MAG: SGNH/GDSL hydrolase family protein [Hyphomonadaceae bacterium TMED125]HBH88792.1 lipase [Hyphomonadaceae bacterium]